jgi:hypothetical protein
VGAPDLYHYSYDELSPVYEWDIMERDLNPPQHMGAYMKYRYGGWISSIPEITSDGTYDLNPLISATNNCYKIASPYSSAEYFMVEYRRKSGTFENSLPGEGLLVYRINTRKDGMGNDEGPPDEVYIYRPDGTTTVNGSPSSANFSTDADRTAINDTTNPITITMDADKSITASFTAISTGDGDEGTKKGGCFIATAAYGSPLHPHLDILRDFRDKYLMPNGFGRKLVEMYYRYSPGVAGFIAGHKLLKAAVRINLLPVIAFSSLMVYFGPAATAIVLVFMLVFLILFIRFYPGRVRVL